MCLNTIKKMRSGALWGFAVLFTAGCGNRGGEPYDANLQYPARTDLLVITPPANAPGRLHETGKLTEWMNALPAQGAKTIDPQSLSSDVKAALQDTLKTTFGTPANPTLNHLNINNEQLALGSKLYRQHCLHCHGLAGEGRGPTGDWIQPRPRDFRQGLFKYTTSSTPGIPTRSDLKRVIRHGVPGTAMQPYELLSDAEIDAMASTVIHLSIRGEVEYRLIQTVKDDGLSAVELKEEQKEIQARVVSKWASARETTMPPAPFNVKDEAGTTPERHAAAARGYVLFNSTKAGCSSCHVNYGKDDRFLFDAWGSAVRVKDLSSGEFHGGQRVEDIYQRIRIGILPSGMPAAMGLTDAETWDLAAFCKAFSKPQWLPPEVRQHFYPGQ